MQQALYDIAHCIGERLFSLELDNLQNSQIIERVRTLHTLSKHCPNIARLSLCQFFQVKIANFTINLTPNFKEGESMEQCFIEGTGLVDVDLYGVSFFIKF